MAVLCHSLESWLIKGDTAKGASVLFRLLVNLFNFVDIEVILQKSKLTYIQKTDFMQVLWDLMRG